MALGISIHGFKTWLESKLWESYPIIDIFCHDIYGFIGTGLQKSMGSIEPIEPTLTPPHMALPCLVAAV